MSQKKYSTVDDYLTDFNGETKNRLEIIRSSFLELIPNVEERISYNIPAYFMNGSMIGYFAGYENHVSLYPFTPTGTTFDKEVARYLSGRSTLKFTHANPLPVEVVKKFISNRIAATL